MLCPNCGKTADDDAVFCPHCGESLKSKKTIRRSRSSALFAGILTAVCLLLLLFSAGMLLKDRFLRTSSHHAKHADHSQPARISFRSGDVELPVGGSFELRPIVSPSGANCDGMEWSSSDPGVAEVDQEGRVSAVAPGRATVSAGVGEVVGQAEVFVYEYEIELLANKVLREGSFDEDYGWYYYPLSYEETEENGYTVCRYTELICSGNGDELAYCCDVYDKDVTMFYETFLNFKFGDRQNAEFYFTCSCGGDEQGRPVLLNLSDQPAFEAEAEGRLSIPSYVCGSRLTFTDYNGDASFRSTAEEIAASMVGYSMEILSVRWSSLKMPCSLKEMIGFEKL